MDDPKNDEIDDYDMKIDHKYEKKLFARKSSINASTVRSAQNNELDTSAQKRSSMNVPELKNNNK